MKDAIGGSSLLNLVIIFTSVVILLFAGILAYSKAYKIKNRIIEVIERSGTYGNNEVTELKNELKKFGYRSATSQQIINKCDQGTLTKDAGYFYCVYFDDSSAESGYSYKVVTYVHFDFPVIGSMVEIPVKGQTKILGKKYDY